MSYIADSIGGNYKNWALNQEERIKLQKPSNIFISSPTGSGKTTFILEKFLPYLAEKQKKVLYLVNRTILKKQIKEKIERLSYEQRSAIDVELYQTIEKKISDGSSIDKYVEYDCVICDEAHYFLMDSNYNTKTIISYKFVRDCFNNKLQIYMSATIEQIKEVIEEDNNSSKYYRTYWFGIHLDQIEGRKSFLKPKGDTYFIERNYDYININLLRKEDEISEIVVKGNEKWLIFVDNKRFGKKLKEEISRKCETTEKKDSVFITSAYGDKQENSDEVDKIVKSNKDSVKVLIATSVLDNGINFKDIELRNIIIITDNETEFIQMLGRKRKDDKPVNLYIYKQTENHFRRRLDDNNRKRRIAEENYKRIKRKMISYGQDGQWNISIDEINKIEQNLIRYQHNFLLREMMEDVDVYEDIKASFVALEGVLCLNMLAFKNLENLGQFYGRMLDNFEKYGENAFLWEQLRWLGKTDQEIECLIEDLDKSQIEKSRQTVIKALEPFKDKQITKNEFIEVKKQIKGDLINLVESVDDEDENKIRYLNLTKKDDRPISKEFMDFLSKYCEIPFKVTFVKEQSTYKIEQV